MTGRARAVAFVPDLMDRSRFGGRAEFVASVDELAAAASGDDVAVVVVDLGRPGVIEALRGLPDGVRTIGFGSHVDRDLLAAATDAGCDEVLPRSQFFTHLPDLLP